MTDSDLKKLCRNIYKKYKNEINILIDNAPTITSFLKDMSIYINKNNNEYLAHSGNSLLTLSPKKWITNTKFKGSTKYSKVRVEYNYIFETTNFFLTLLIPNTDEFINIVMNKSNELFDTNLENKESWNNWGNKYIVMQKWESFQIEDNIDEWDNNVKEYSKLILE